MAARFKNFGSALSALTEKRRLGSAVLRLLRVGDMAVGPRFSVPSEPELPRSRRSRPPHSPGPVRVGVPGPHSRSSHSLSGATWGKEEMALEWKCSSVDFAALYPLLLECMVCISVKGC